MPPGILSRQPSVGPRRQYCLAEAWQLTQVIQSIQDESKALDPFEVILPVFDVTMPGVNVDPGRRVEMQCARLGDQGFGLGNVRLPEKELSVQVG